MAILFHFGSARDKTQDLALATHTFRPDKVVKVLSIFAGHSCYLQLGKLPY